MTDQRLIVLGMFVFVVAWLAYFAYQIDKMDARITNIEMAKEP